MKTIRKLFNSLNPVNYDNPKSVASRLRKARFAFFENQINKLGYPILTVLDVGGEEHFWLQTDFYKRQGVRIVLLNIRPEATTQPNITSVAGDGTKMSQYRDGEFDLVFSNSVIEHLYTKKNQVLMAKEVMRVGKYYFVQTPNKFFPIEPHFLLPFFNFLPRSLQEFILVKTRLSRGHKIKKESAKSFLNELRLMSFKELREVFPESRIYREKILGLTKSFAAHNI
jgi:hypothetical protein